VYIRGKLFIQCAERGLTDPFKGGDVKLKAFMDSLKHACKVRSFGDHRQITFF
jgi:hypothetical protein